MRGPAGGLGSSAQSPAPRPSRMQARDGWILGEASLQSWTSGGWDLNLVWEWVREEYATPESCAPLQRKALILQALNGGVSLGLSAPPGVQWGSARLPPPKCRANPFQQPAVAAHDFGRRRAVSGRPADLLCLAPHR